MTKEEIEKTFAGVSHYYAYKQGLQDGVSYDWEAFRREAVKDFVIALVSSGNGLNPKNIAYSIEMADELIKQLKEDEK